MARLSLRASLVTMLLVVTVLCATAFAGEFGGFHSRVAFAPRRQAPLVTTSQSSLFVRGGASLEADDEEEDDEESDDEEEEEEEIVGKVIEEIEDYDDDEEEEEDDIKVDPKLTAAAMKSAAKAKAKVQSQKTTRVKKAVQAKLSKSKPQKAVAKKSSGSMFTIPYIMKALLNPFTVFAMTKSYWVSLFNLDYPPKDSSQDLRSSIEEKNRNAGPSTFQKPKRKMKRGQAKTLSDLPQLNT